MATITLPTLQLEGTIYDAFNAPLPKVTVQIFDKDLRKEQLLGTVKTDKKGRYKLKYKAYTFLRAEKKSADIFIRVFVDKSLRKELGKSPIHFNVPEKYVLDFKVDGTEIQGLSEFDTLLNTIMPLLRGQGKGRRNLAVADLKEEDIRFISQEAGVDNFHLSLLAIAFKYTDVARDDIAAAIFYGLLRLDFPKNITELLSLRSENLIEGIKDATSRNIISKKWLVGIKGIVEDIRAVATALILDPKEKSNLDFKKVLEMSIPDKRSRTSFVRTFLDSNAKPENFWKALKSKSKFKNGKLINEVQDVLRLNLITNQPDLSHHLYQLGKNDPDLKDIRGFAKFNRQDFKKHIKTVVQEGKMKSFPVGIKGETTAEKTKNYADALEGLVHTLFPTEVFKHKIVKDNDHPFGRAKGDLLTFFNQNPNFDLNTSKIDQLLGESNRTGIHNQENLRQELKKINRIYKLTPDYDFSKKIRTAGLNSAHDIVNIPKAIFVNSISSGTTADIGAASDIYDRAIQTDMISSVLVSNHKTKQDIPTYATHGTGGESSDYQSMFGDNILCECAHCQSVYSPSAYLIDMLNFIRINEDSALDALNTRRPDIEHTLLTCKNTNTPLPYIDLVNELLENKISNSELPESSDDVPQTNNAAEELVAFPEHVQSDVYKNKLSKAFSSFQLPFNLPLEEVRIYLDKVNCKRYELMELFYGKKGNHKYSDVSIAAEYLGLSLEELNVINGTDNDAFANISSNRVRDFLEHTGISFLELLQLLECYFINPVKDENTLERTISIVVDEEDELANSIDPTTCNIDYLSLEGFDDESIQTTLIFIRLWKKLNWDIFDIDRIFTAFAIKKEDFDAQQNEINAKLIIPLSHISRIKLAYNLNVSEILAFWFDIATTSYIMPTKSERVSISSFYDSLFQNKKIFDANEEQLGKPETLGGNIEAKFSLLAAAFNISESDLNLIRTFEINQIRIINGQLNLQNLSTLYRYTNLAKILRLKVEEVLLFIKVIGFSPFMEEDKTLNTLRFIEKVNFIKSSEFSILELRDLLKVHTNNEVPLDPNAVVGVLSNLREGLQKIDVQFIEIGNDAIGEEKRLTAQKTFIIETISTTFNADAKIIDVLVNDLVRFTGNNSKSAITPFLESEFITSKKVLVTTHANAQIIWTFSELVNTYILLYKTWIRIAHLIHKISITTDEFVYLQSNEVKLQIAGIWNLPEDDFGQFTSFENLIHIFDFKKKLARPTEDWLTIFNATEVEANFFSTFNLLTGIEKQSITFLKHASVLNLTFPNDFLKGENLVNLIQCASKTKELGSTVENLSKLTTPNSGNKEALIAKHLLKAKYEEKAWLDVIKPISNELRSKKRNALVSYLLTASEFADFRTNNSISSVNDLFAYFLIDIEMAPCMMTSRIKQAISSVQLYIDRCLLGLENEADDQQAKIELGEGFTHQWNEWRKIYRVWETNRKVFLYAENWIEPDLRDDKTPFFKALEAKLTQNEVTDEVAKDALLEYLEKLDQVANLQVVSFFHDKSTGISHFIGRTRNIPNEYFYRQREKSIWSPWEKMELDIQGDHILMVVWNNQLQVYWGAFTEKQDKGGSSPVSKDNNGEFKVEQEVKYLDMKLHWSTYKNNKWGAKKIADKSLKVTYSNTISGLDSIHKLFLRSFINDNGLYIRLFQPEDINWNGSRGNIALSSMLSNTPEVRSPFDASFKNISFKRVRGDNFDFIGGLDGVIDDGGDGEEEPEEDTSSETPDDDTYHFDNCNSSPRTILGSNIVKSVHAVKARNTQFEYPFLSRNNKSQEPLRITGSGPQRLDLENIGMVLLDKTPDAFKILPSHTENEGTIRFFIQNEKSNFFVEPDIFLFRNNKFTFHPFYHPYVCEYIKAVKTKGINGLYTKEIQQMKEADLLRFQEYDPTSNVKNKPIESVDFSMQGAYSSYNWELFFHIPLLIATRLNQNQKFYEARKYYHYIFNPTAPSDVAMGAKRFWITKPFIKEFEQGSKSLEELINEPENEFELEKQLEYWQDNPFNPHAVARLRNSAYMRSTVMKYIQNLMDWGDQLFRRDSIESINEATLLYVLAANLLGEKPDVVPPRTEPKESSFNAIKNDLGLFSTAKVAVESFIAPLELDNETVVDNPIFMPLLCLPKNDKLLGYWDTVADKLFKIRHCMNIDGEVRQLPLFEPPIDPALLVRAKAAGLDLNAIMNDITATLPNYRFQMMLQKANELCNDVKSLGSQLLSALEKKDGEELALLRSGHELKLLELVRDIKKLQINEAKENLKGMLASQANVENRKAYYENKEYKNSKESIHLRNLNYASYNQYLQGANEIVAGFLLPVPDTTAGAWSWGINFGGEHLAGPSKALAASLGALSNYLTTAGNIASVEGGYLRRQEDWNFQAESAKLELKQIEKQVIAAEIRIAIAEKDLSNHEKQMEQFQKVDDYMRDKFTNAELYNYMVTQISGIYFQTYQMAYDFAKKAEKCYQFELGITGSNLIKFGHWDSLKKGLLSGEKLQFDLRQLESSFIENNKRELELSKHFSLKLINPLALIKLREIGKCQFLLPEELFDLDYPGHYFRRIKSVSISLPCIAGPYTTIACSLSLTRNEFRNIDTGVQYKRIDEEDARFSKNLIAVNSIATSSAQNDSGVFELNFRDERYLPFEGAGVASSWTIDLFNDDDASDFGKSLRQFNYDTISDAIIHVKYTAREGTKEFKQKALNHLRVIQSENENTSNIKIINLKHDFSSEWHRFLNPNGPADGRVLDFKLTSNHFPYRDSGHTLKINSITAIAKCAKIDAYTIKITTNGLTLEDIIINKSDVFGDLHHQTKNVSANSPILDFTQENNWKIEIETPVGQGVNLEKNEIEEIFLILGYVWQD